MLGHYIMVALRNFLRRPLIFLINVLTLSLGLICFVTAYAVAGFWNRAEQHFPKADRTFVVTTDVLFRDGSASSGALPGSHYHFAPYLQADYPEVETVARARIMNENAALSAGDRTFRLYTVSVDAEFLDIFDLPFVRGDARNALRNPGSIVLTEAAAARLFPGMDPIGKTVSLANLVDGTVKGVIAAIPEPSHMGRSASALLRFDVLTSEDLFEFFSINATGSTSAELPENWLATNLVTYVLFRDENGARNVRRQLEDFARRHVPDEQLRRAEVRYDLVPVSELLGMATGQTVFLRESGISVSTALLLLASLVLIVACVNFANLSAALATGRIRDVGIRKALGARRTQIIQQHLAEVGLVTVAAFLLALVLIQPLIPLLYSWWGIDLRVSLLADVRSWLSLLAVIAAVTLLAGSYPALLLSRTTLASTLRTRSLRAGRGVASTLLVAAQFAAANFLLISLVFIYSQNSNMERTALRGAEDPLLVLENYTEITHLAQDTLRAELLELPHVRAVTAMAQPPWSGHNGVFSLSRSADETENQQGALRYRVGFDFLSTLNIPLLAGRDFSRDRDEGMPPPGSSRPVNVILDRALAASLGFHTPEAAVDQLIYIRGNSVQPAQVIGVAESASLNLTRTDGPAASFFVLSPPLPFHVARISADNVAETLGAVDSLWKRLVPTLSINRRFADDYFNASYEPFSRVSQAFVVLAAFALVIASIGVLAISLLVANARLRELALRKTFGAKRRQMLVLLLTSFSTPIVAGVLLAWPAAYFAARTYLAVFVEPIELTAIPFAICTLLTLVIACLAISSQSWHAASMKPASVLRY